MSSKRVPMGVPALAAVCVALLLTAPGRAEAGCQGAGKGCSVFKQCCDGLSCQPLVQKCYHSPRQVGEPCSAGYGCGPGLTCEAGSQKCRGPGREGDPCHLTRPCGAGLTCEAGTQRCKAPGRVGDGCHATRPCGPGLTCQPGVQKCFHSPRLEGEPCSLGFECGGALTCEAGSQVCRRPSQEGETCHATRPCGPGLTCEAGSQKCRAPGKLKDPCHLTRPCGEGLSCQPGVMKCYHQPRWPGEPCVAGHECKKGFSCQPFVQKCVAGKIDYSMGGLCDQLKVPELASLARDLKQTMTYSVGSSAGAGVMASIEQGTVYGRDGEFGCFITACAGLMSDAAIADFANFAAYNAPYSKIAGWSAVTSGGGSFPIVEIGGGGGQIWAAEEPRSVEDIVKKNYLGSVVSLTFGVGVLPAQVATNACYTLVVDGKQTVASMAEAERQAKAKATSKQSGGAAVVATPAPPPPTPTPTPAPTPPTPTPAAPDVGPGPGWTRCAQEGGTCTFAGTQQVRYGANDRYVTREATNGVACTNGVFGDPIVGVVKSCWVAAAGPAPTNVARGKRATQSSTAFGGLAARAVDGNPNGAYGANSVSHTNNEPGAWWMVDLGAEYRIDRVVIHNRTDCCAERLQASVVVTTAEGWPGAPRVFERPLGPPRPRIELPVSTGQPVYGRYVYVVQGGAQYLSLAEVEVIGVPR